MSGDFFRDVLQGRFGKKASTERAMPDRSGREIADARARVGRELSATLYLYADRMFILTAITGITESGEPAIFDTDVDDDALGNAACDKLLEYSPGDNRSLKGHTLADWAAYQVSKAKSAKQFERDSIAVSLATLNSALRIEAAPRMSEFPELRALCSISTSATHAEVGQSIRRAIRAVKVLRDAGMV